MSSWLSMVAQSPHNLRPELGESCSTLLSPHPSHSNHSQVLSISLSLRASQATITSLLTHSPVASQPVSVHTCLSNISSARSSQRNIFQKYLWVACTLVSLLFFLNMILDHSPLIPWLPNITCLGLLLDSGMVCHISSFLPSCPTLGTDKFLFTLKS